MLGSVFLNPTVAAGVALGSGGTQLRKGPGRAPGAVGEPNPFDGVRSTLVDSGRENSHGVCRDSLDSVRSYVSFFRQQILSLT